MTQPSTAAVTLEPRPQAVDAENGASKAKPRESTRFLTTPVGRVLWRTFRICSSLQLAIALLSLFTLCLALATLLESWYSAQIAKDLVYRTWWFAGLLGALAVNVLCAALKKYPWKRHQIGFLITHTGLLVLIFGGLLTNMNGLEGQMIMIDTEHPGIQRHFAIPNSTDTIQFVDRHQLEIVRIPEPSEGGGDPELLKGLEGFLFQGLELTAQTKKMLRDKNGYWEPQFWPGSFQWKSDEHLKHKLPWGVRILKTMANPRPGFTMKLGDKGSIQIENFYPHAESWPFSPAEQNERHFPALNLQLTTGGQEQPMERWITSLPMFERDTMPIAIELFVLDDSDLLPEFLDPPSKEELGKNGKVVLLIGPERKRVEVDLNKVEVGKPAKIGDGKIKFTLVKRGRLMEMLGHGNHQLPPKEGAKRPLYPAVKFKLEGPEWNGTYVGCARMPHFPAYQIGSGAPLVTVWYHYPDFRWGDKGKLGALQFIKTSDARLFYRVYGSDGLKGRGNFVDTSDRGKKYKIPLGPMSMEMTVAAWLPKATERDYVIPFALQPGADTPSSIQPAMRCTLVNGGVSKEFWVRMSRRPTRVNVGRNLFLVRYRRASRQMDFRLTLNHAQRVTDPGSSRPASFQSDVTLSYKDGGKVVHKDAQIYMNHTLDYGPYKVYQTKFEPIIHSGTGRIVTDPKTQRMVSMSGLTVGHDPGLNCKYAGSCLLVLGIATMFYMKAYFFKPRKRKQPAAA